MSPATTSTRGPGGLTEEEEIQLETLHSYSKVAATTFVSTPGAEYYRLEPKDLPRPAPFAQAVTLNLELRGRRSIPEHEGDPVTEQLRALRYTSNLGVTGVFELEGSDEGSPFLRGQVLFFRYAFNPDPGSDGVPVHRTVALGLRPVRRLPDTPRWGDFGFLREIDTFGTGFPEVTGREEDFQIFTSPAAYADPTRPSGPFLTKEFDLVAGSLAALA